MKKILILGPAWRNKNIIEKLKNNYFVLITNEKINTKYIKTNKIKYLVTSGYPYKINKKL